MTLQDAKDFCDWLSTETGWAYRLPTEAEWEYACRAGTMTRYWWGDEWDETRVNGAKKVGKTTGVGDYPPNPWGLRDIRGNVFEWCEDHYETVVRKLPSDGSAHVVTEVAESNRRAMRGGSWNHVSGLSRCAHRDHGKVTDTRPYIGFRLARTL